jgi:hypothetical protein
MFQENEFQIWLVNDDSGSTHHSSSFSWVMRYVFMRRAKIAGLGMSSTSTLIWGMLFGAIGLGFFMYGKKQRAGIPLLTGIALFIVPYFIPNVYVLVMVGILLIALPYFVRI